MENLTNRTRIEILFNSVEVELARRWAHGNVPAVYVPRPVHDLKQTLKAWWNLYHETTCANEGVNRDTWKRSAAYPAQALTTQRLISSLREIRDLIKVEAINAFRKIHSAEHSAIALLDITIHYYVKLPD